MRDFARLLLRHHAAGRPFLHSTGPLCKAAARVLAVLMDRPPLTLSAIAGVVHDADLDPSERCATFGYRPIGCARRFEALLSMSTKPMPTTRTSLILCLRYSFTLLDVAGRAAQRL